MSVTGTWNLTLNSPLGDQSATLQIQEAGGAYQGTLRHWPSFWLANPGGEACISSR